MWVPELKDGDAKDGAEFSKGVYIISFNIR